jgi:DNA-binding XRE family transcriptional regulator
MTLRDWQARHGFTYDTAAAALGVSRRTYARLLKREALPLSIILAMKWINKEKK